MDESPLNRLAGVSQNNGAAVGAPSREYVYGGGALLAEIASSTTTYYHQDHLSNRLVTSSSGATVEQMGHFPFGESWYNATNDKLLFTSYERDAESGNDYAMARYHMSRLGKFSSPDPLSGDISNPQSLNRYAYVLNNPISFVDPLGLYIGFCKWDNHQRDDPPANGGATKEECRAQGGSWVNTSGDGGCDGPCGVGDGGVLGVVTVVDHVNGDPEDGGGGDQVGCSPPTSKLPTTIGVSAGGTVAGNANRTTSTASSQTTVVVDLKPGALGAGLLANVGAQNVPSAAPPGDPVANGVFAGAGYQFVASNLQPAQLVVQSTSYQVTVNVVIFGGTVAYSKYPNGGYKLSFTPAPALPFAFGLGWFYKANVPQTTVGFTTRCK